MYKGQIKDFVAVSSEVRKQNEVIAKVMNVMAEQTRAQEPKIEINMPAIDRGTGLEKGTTPPPAIIMKTE